MGNGPTIIRARPSLELGTRIILAIGNAYSTTVRVGKARVGMLCPFDRNVSQIRTRFSARIIAVAHAVAASVELKLCAPKPRTEPCK